MNLTKKTIYITAAGIFFLVFIFNLLHISDKFIWDDRYFIAFNNYYNECSNIKKYLNFNPFHIQPLPLISRPFTSISLLLDKCIFSNTRYLPEIFKIKNILLHAINTSLLFLLLLKIANNIKISLLFSLYFAFNPVNLDLLNIATFRNYLFSLFFILIILIDIITRKKISIASIVLYTISLFFGEIPFFLSLIFFLYIKYIKQHINITKTLVFTLIIINAFYILYRLPRGYYEDNAYIKSYSLSYTQSDKKLLLKHINLYSKEKHENRNLTYKINNFAFFLFKLIKVFILPSNETNYKEIKINSYYSISFLIFLVFIIFYLIKLNPIYSLLLNSVLLIAFIYSGFLFHIPNHLHNRFFYIPIFLMIIFTVVVLTKIRPKYIMIYFTLNLFIFILTTHYNYIYYKNNYLFLSNEYEKSPTNVEIIKGLIYENLKYCNTLKAKELNKKLIKLNGDEKFYLKNEFIINVIENNYSKANGIYKKIKKIISKKEDITLFEYIINAKSNKKYNNFPESPNSFEFKLIKSLLENSKIYINKKDFYTKELISFYKYSLKLPVKAEIIYY